MTPLNQLIERLSRLSRSIPQNTKENRAIKGAYAHAVVIAKEHIEHEKSQLENAHMAGQRNAGIDPSAHAALAYFRDLTK